ncbi:MAG: alkylation response protein AidB-like acyl-CoA dehydrogenase [Candidatus Aldehydirespiratoraceae bacterium]|jgi:alkylation response protein AidB-like acyl-CoA dehydrogenase
MSYDNEVNDTIWQKRASEVAEHLGEGVVQADQDGELPIGAVESLKLAGLTTALIPEDCDGGGATHADMAEVLRRLGRRDPSTALTLSMHSHVVAAQVWRHNQGMDATGFFDKVVGGAYIVTSGASDWIDSSGTADAADGGFRVNATKMPISGCEAGQIFATTVRHESPDGDEVLHFAIPMASEGLRIERTWDTLGLRATGSHTVVLDDVFVPAAAISLRRPAGVWHPIWSAVLGCAMPLIMSVYAGIADAAVAAAITAAARKHDAATDILVGEMLNFHTAGLDAVEAMTHSSDNLHFANTDEHAARVLSRKSNAADAFIATVRTAVEVAGGAGYSRRFDLERMLRDVHGCMFHPLPRVRQREFSGRTALGRSPVA